MKIKVNYIPSGDPKLDFTKIKVDRTFYSAPVPSSVKDGSGVIINVGGRYLPF